MGKFIVWLFVIAIIVSSGGYYYYTKTGYKFGLDDTFLFKGTIGISTSSFSDGAVMPPQFTCDGDNVSPEFTLSRIPEGTKSIAVVLEDEDTKPPFTHWLVFNYNPEVKTIDSTTAWQNGIVGTNDFGDKDYQGPCPPTNETHKYLFKAYALNFNIVSDNQVRKSFDSIIESHVLATGTISAVYSKKP